MPKWTLDETIAYATSQLGETDGTKYARIAVGWASPYDWCAYYCSALKVLGDLDCPYFPNGFAFDKRDLPAIGDRWVEPYDLRAGDFIGFDWDGGWQRGGDHVGFVVKRNGPGDYDVNEGNCGGAVRLKHRTVANTRSYNPDGSLKGMGIIGGIRPKYKNGKTIQQKLYVDGVFGPNTCRALQEALQKHGYYKGYLLDGDWGYYSKRETQRYLRALGYYTNAWLLDGWFGTASVKALQSYLRKLGYYTDAYLLDGDWGKYTTIALQKALNAGKF